MILTIVVNVIPVVLRSTNTQPIRDSYVDLGYLGNLHKYFYLLQMSECLEKVFANNRFLVGFTRRENHMAFFGRYTVHQKIIKKGHIQGRNFTKIIGGANNLLNLKIGHFIMILHLSQAKILVVPGHLGHLSKLRP